MKSTGTGTDQELTVNLGRWLCVVDLVTYNEFLLACMHALPPYWHRWILGCSHRLPYHCLVRSDPAKCSWRTDHSRGSLGCSPGLTVTASLVFTVGWILSRRSLCARFVGTVLPISQWIYSIRPNWIFITWIYTSSTEFRFFQTGKNQDSAGLRNIARLFDWSRKCRNRVSISDHSIPPGKG